MVKVHVVLNVVKRYIQKMFVLSIYILPEYVKEVLNLAKSNMINLLASKHLFELEDGHKIQLVTARNNYIICFPSQVGCHYREICKICSAKEYVRDLSLNEMGTSINKVLTKDTRLISCMGEGEPLDNPLVAELLNLYSQRFKTAISTRVPSIDKLKQFIINSPYTKIQFSSHTMKIDMLEDALKLTKKCNVEVNLVAHNDVKFFEIGAMAHQYNRTIKLSRWNDYRYNETYRQFIFESLTEMDYKVEIYNHDGREINASCGQLKSF